MSQESEYSRKFNGWVPFLLLTLYAGIVGWLTWTESLAKNIASVIFAVFLIVLLWLWWTFASGLQQRAKWQSFFVGLFIGGAVVLAGKFLVRYEGSLDGSAIPRFVWRWAPTAEERLLENGAAELSEATARGAQALEPIEVPGVYFDSARYLGAEGDGRVSAVPLATDWEQSPPEQIWRQGIGLGWGGFSVVEGYAVTLEQRGTEEWVSCYHLLTGQLLWVHRDVTRFSEGMGGDGPRSTPTIQDGLVFALGGKGWLNCIELKTGKLKWSQQTLEAEARNNLVWGKSSSPCVLPEQKLVVVTGGDKGGPTVIAFSMESGELEWKWGLDAASYSSPVLREICGVEQLVSVNENTIVGLEPQTGKLLWSHDWPVGMSASTAKAAQPQIIGGNQLYLTASYGVGSSLVDIRLSESGEWSTQQVWRKKTKMKTKFSSTCVIEGHAFGLDEGVFACQEIATGKRLWKGERYGYGQNLLTGDVFLIQAEKGTVVLVEATASAFKELATFPALEGKTWNTPTLAGQYLLVRNDTEAACYRLPLK